MIGLFHRTDQELLTFFSSEVEGGIAELDSGLSVPHEEERRRLGLDLARGCSASLLVFWLYASNLGWYVCVINSPFEPLHLLQR